VTQLTLFASLLLALALAGGCGLSIPPASPNGPSHASQASASAAPAATEEPSVQQSFREITFRMPASWSVTRPWGAGRYGPERWLTSVAIASVCEPVRFYPRKTCFVTSRKDVAPSVHANETGVLPDGGVVIAFSGRGRVRPAYVPATPAFFARDTSLECKALGGRELTWVVWSTVITACVQGTVARYKVETIIASIVVVPQG
jgi:hypothetical protein